MASSLAPSAGTRHRWLVALPVFVLTLTGTTAIGLLGNGDLPVFHQAAGQPVLPVGDSGIGMIVDDATIDVSQHPPVVTAGEVLLASKSLIQVRAGNLLLQGWKGGFSVNAGSTHITIAALTAPVHVTSFAGGTMVIPAGMQWQSVSGPLPEPTDWNGWSTARRVLPLPEHFLEERLRLLHSMGFSSEFVSRSMPSVPLIGSLTAVLGTAQAQRRSETESASRLLSDLAALIESGDREAADAFLVLHRDVLQTDTGKAYLPVLLSLAADKRWVPMFLEEIEPDDAQWLLASTHPLTRDVFWVLDDGKDGSVDQRIHRLTALLRGNILPETVSGPAMDAWAGEAEAIAALQKDRCAMMKMLADDVRSLAVRWKQKGFFQRILRYNVAVQVLAEGCPDVSLQDLADNRMDLTPSSVFSATVASPEKTDAPLTEQQRMELEGQMRDVLASAGGMMTPDTHLLAVSADEVRVRDMVFATATGDKPFIFSIDPRTKQVSRIVSGGTILAYPLPFEKFLEWVKLNGRAE